MKYLLIFLFSIPLSYAQIGSVSSVGNRSEPDVLIQVRSDQQARQFLVNQIYDIVKALKPGKNFFENQLGVQKNEIVSLLTTKNMKKKTSDTLEQILFVNFGGGADLDAQDVKEALVGRGAFRKDRRFKNKLALNVRLNDLSYKIDPEGINLTEMSSYADEKNLYIDLKMKLSKIFAKANDICISFSTFVEEDLPGGEWQISKRDTNYECHGRDILLGKINSFVEDFVAGQGVDVNVKKIQEEFGSLEYFRNIGMNVHGIEAQINEVAPIALNVTLKVGFKGRNLNLEIEEGSIDRFVEDMTPRELRDKVDLRFMGDKSADMIGFSGLILQQFPVKFDDTKINQALLKRKDELIKLLVTPIANDLENIIGRMTEEGKTKYNIRLNGQIKAEELGGIGYKFSSVSLLNSQTAYEQLSTTVDMWFGEEEISYKTQDFDYDYNALVQSMAKHIEPSKSPERTTDMVVSVGENLINDLIQHGLKKFEEKIGETILNPEFVNFRVEDLPSDVIEIEDDRLDLAKGYIKACAEIKLKKWHQRSALKFLFGKKGVRVPVMAITDIKLVFNKDGAPEFIFDIPYIVNEKSFLEEGFEDCQVSKRLKRVSSSIIAGKIGELYNLHSDEPLVKIVMNPLKDFNGELMRMVVDKENRRLNFLISLKNTNSVNDQILERIRLNNEKFEVVLPKVKALSSPKDK